MTASTMEGLRSALDDLDHQLFEVLKQRFEVVQEVARLKRQSGIAMLQPAREEIVRERYRARAGQIGLPDTFGDDLFTLILTQAYALENRIIDGA